ncbi:hypothetical protein [Phocaeicola paurosaccharolyticus]|uniref:hypothetical protein n=1 Tax=Phocaeicola paurosaccharolyticus TaxID=732242 RepID=UPI002FDF32F8
MGKHENILHSTAEWEKANTKGYTFQHMYYTEKLREVRLVTGTIPVCKKVIVNGQSKITPTQMVVRWDGFGHCWLGRTAQVRKRDYDIIFKEKEDEN